MTMAVSLGLNTDAFAVTIVVAPPPLALNVDASALIEGAKRAQEAIKTLSAKAMLKRRFKMTGTSRSNRQSRRANR